MKTTLITVILFSIICLNNNVNAQRNKTISDKIKTRIDLSNFKPTKISSDFGINQTNLLPSYKTRSLIQQNDSIYYWVLDSTLTNWMYRCKNINMVYDGNTNLLSSIILFYYGNTWDINYKTNYTYDVHNNRTSELGMMWYDTAWLNSDKGTYKYDDHNNKISSTYEMWLDDSWYLLDAERDIYSYDAENNIISDIYQDFEGGYWVDINKVVNAYDNSGNLIYKYNQEEIWQGTWIDYEKITYTYNSKNNLTSYVEQYLNDTVWENRNKYTYTYDANNNLSTSLHQHWNTNIWENDTQTTFTFDNRNNLIAFSSKLWINNAWLNFEEFRSTYDVDNFIKSNSIKLFDSTGTRIISGDSIYYYFKSEVGINDFKTLNKGIIVYPNPNNGKFIIKSYSDLSSIEVYNLTGELLYSDYNLKRQTSVDIDLSDFQKGIYFARISDGKSILTEKILIH